jgi:flagellar secretion chaperone FliS
MARPHAFAQAYRRHDVETRVAFASAHELITMLFDGYVDAVAQARGAMRKGEIEAKCRGIVRASRIVDEGLKAALNLRDGGPLAEDLRQLYDYVVVRLAQANLRNDERALDECLTLIQPLREAWAAIGPQVDAKRA